MSLVVYNSSYWDEILKITEVLSLSEEIHKNISARICGWAISLMTFDYDIVHQEGRKILYANALSRLQFQTNENNELEATKVYKEINFATCNAYQ